MPNLSIKDVPEDTLELLRARAKMNRRSMQGELLTILEEAVKPRGLTMAEVRERIKALGISSGDDSTAWIRADRDAR